MHLSYDNLNISFEFKIVFNIALKRNIEQIFHYILLT